MRSVQAAQRNTWDEHEAERCERVDGGRSVPTVPEKTEECGTGSKTTEGGYLSSKVNIN